MSLHGFSQHKKQHNKSFYTTPICSPDLNINYLNNPNIANLFKYYQSTSSIFTLILIRSLAIELYDQIPFYQKKRSNIIERIDRVIVSARNSINDNPILAINKIEFMINELVFELKDHPENDFGSNAIKDILVKLSADIQILKNEINYELDKVHNSDTRLAASPIYIKL